VLCFSSSRYAKELFVVHTKHLCGPQNIDPPPTAAGYKATATLLLLLLLLL
jgi:hypothetical protein